MTIEFHRLDPISTDLAGCCDYCDERATTFINMNDQPDRQHHCVEPGCYGAATWTCDSEQCIASAVENIRSHMAPR